MDTPPKKHDGYLPLRQIVPITPLLWTCAWLLARARSNSNKGRAQSRDRGADLNLQGDVIGSLGELFVFFQALKHKRTEVASYMRKHLFHPGGGKMTADVVDVPGIDVKTFGCEDHKDYIATNAQSHLHLEGKLQHYYFILVPQWGREAVVSDLVPWADVGDWPSFPLGTYGDPSHNLLTSTFLSRYCPEASLFGLRSYCYKEQTIKTPESLGKAKEILLFQVPSLRCAL